MQKNMAEHNTALTDENRKLRLENSALKAKLAPPAPTTPAAVLRGMDPGSPAAIAFYRAHAKEIDRENRR